MNSRVGSIPTVAIFVLVEAFDFFGLLGGFKGFFIWWSFLWVMRNYLIDWIILCSKFKRIVLFKI